MYGLRSLNSFSRLIFRFDTLRYHYGASFSIRDLRVINDLLPAHVQNLLLRVELTAVATFLHFTLSYTSTKPPKQYYRDKLKTPLTAHYREFKLSTLNIFTFATPCVTSRRSRKYVHLRCHTSYQNTVSSPRNFLTLFTRNHLLLFNRNPALSGTN